MKKIIIVIICIAIAFGGEAVYAKLSLKGQFKPRFEFRDGYRKLTDESLDPAAFISQRTRLIFDYSDSTIITRISAQDVRVWGDELQLRSEPRLGLHEGWAEIRFDQEFSLRMGRQELVYDDHRIFGNVDWAQQGRSHDGAILRYKNNKLNIHLGGAFNQTNEDLFSTNYPLNNYKGMIYTWIGNEIDSNMSYSILVISDANQKSDTVNINYFRNTVGGNYYFNSQSLDLQGTGFYQFGKTNNGVDISAYMFSVQGYYKHGNLKIGAGLDYLSGNDTKSNSYGAFNTLFGTNHKFYGLIDYFLDIPANTAGGGLVDLYAKLQYDITSQLTFNLDYHSFSLEKPIVNPANGNFTEKGMATEIDFFGNYRISKAVDFQFGYSYLIPSETLQIVQSRPNGINSHWLWMMFVVTPEFFTNN